MIKKRVISAIAGVAALGVISTGCSLTADSVADPAFRTLRYEGGDFGGSKFKECVKEGDKLASNDTFYAYPNTQRQDKWDSDNFKQGANSADYGDMVLTDKDGIGINLKVTVPFSLNTSCEEVKVGNKTYPGGTLQAFHEIFGKTRKAYFDTQNDGNESYGPGWLWVMDTFISNCTVQQLTPKVRTMDAETLWLDDSKRQELSANLKDAIQSCVDNAMETDLQFYMIGNATVDKVTPDGDFVSLFRERVEAEKKAETADLNKQAQITQAQAEAAVAAEKAKIKQAEIAAYGSVENYLQQQAINNGQNPFQPTYVVGGSNTK